MAFNRHPERFWWWKSYKGSHNQDVWIYGFDSNDFTRITDYEGNDTWPMWTGDRIYFVSDRTGDVNNIYYYDLGRRKRTQITKFEKHGVPWPSMSADGKKIVFERDARLYVLDTASGKTRRS